MRVKVEGGTNAGWRVLLEARTESWKCPDPRCGHENKPNHIKCLGKSCGRRRP